MHIIQEDIGLPTFTMNPVKKGDSSHVIFVIGPLPPGYGMTLGNSMRRVLLSSLPGAAVTSMRVAGVHHEYTTLKGVRESFLDIGLNMKLLQSASMKKDQIDRDRNTTPNTTNMAARPVSSKCVSISLRFSKKRM